MRRWARAALLTLILVVASELAPVFAEPPKPRQPAKLDAEMLLELDVLSDERFGEPAARSRSEDDEWTEFEEPAETDERDGEKRQ